MKKIIIYLLILTLSLLSACANSSVEESKASKERGVQSTERESTNQEKDSKVGQEDSFIFQYNDIELKLDKDLKDLIVLDDPYLVYRDQTLPEQDIILGTFESMSLEEWETWNGDYALANYDDSNLVHVFNVIFDWPYSEGEYTAQYEQYMYTLQLLVNNFMRNDYIIPTIIMEQVPDPLVVQDQKAGVEISRSMYQDLENWYTTLTTSFKNEMSLDEKYEMISTIQQEIEQEYPEFRQIPFPSIELAENIIQAFSLLSEWIEFPYKSEKLNHLVMDNQLEQLRQFLEVIDTQIKEFE